MLPAYIDRTKAERQIAILGTKEETLDAALKLIEKLIEGEPSRFKLVNKFFDFNSAEKNKADWKSLYFTIKELGEKAGITYDLIFIRFLALIQWGNKFYEANEKEINALKTAEEDLMGLYLKLQKFIDKKCNGKSATATPKEDSEEFVFAANSHSIPEWAVELKNQVDAIKDHLNESQQTAAVEEEQDEADYNFEDEEDCYRLYQWKNPSNAYPKSDIRKPPVTCFNCGLKGHLSYNCIKKNRCSKCGGIGHTFRECPSRIQQNRMRTSQNHMKTL